MDVWESEEVLWLSEKEKVGNDDPPLTPRDCGSVEEEVADDSDAVEVSVSSLVVFAGVVIVTFVDSKAVVDDSTEDTEMCVLCVDLQFEGTQLSSSLDWTVKGVASMGFLAPSISCGCTVIPPAAITFQEISSPVISDMDTVACCTELLILNVSWKGGVPPVQEKVYV